LGLELSPIDIIANPKQQTEGSNLNVPMVTVSATSSHFENPAAVLILVLNIAIRKWDIRKRPQKKLNFVQTQ
jgi:hypothetical protein